MSRPNKKNTNSQQPKPNDFQIYLGTGLADRAAANKSAKIDAAADRAWLAAHPQATERQRLASSRELKAFNLSVGTMVDVSRGPYGSQVRTFLDPPKRRPPSNETPCPN